MYILNSLVCIGIGSLCGFLAGQYYVYRLIKKNQPWILGAMAGKEVRVCFVEEEEEPNQEQENGH